jgi:hypothetical protein
MRRLVSVACAVGAVTAALAAGSCSKGSSPAEPIPPPLPVATPTPAPARVTFEPPAVEAGCTRGQGSASADCGRSSSAFLPDLEAAIDRTVQEHPEYFNLTEQRGDGGYRILNRERYLAAVITNLDKAGLCGALDMYREAVFIKRTDEMSEGFLIDRNGFIRRGSGSYSHSCSPAAFPLKPEQAVVKMFVGFYNFDCPKSVTPPHHDARQVPITCDGLLTATPKDKNLRTVPPEAHGPAVEWFVTEGDFRIELYDGEHAFNKRIRPLQLGPFSVCANVFSATSCLRGEVIP